MTTLLEAQAQVILAAEALSDAIRDARAAAARAALVEMKQKAEREKPDEAWMAFYDSAGRMLGAPSPTTWTDSDELSVQLGDQASPVVSAALNGWTRSVAKPDELPPPVRVELHTNLRVRSLTLATLHYDIPHRRWDAVFRSRKKP